MTVADQGVHITRTVERGEFAGSVIEFTQREPATPTGRGYRAYHFTPAGGGARRELPSVTTVLGAVVPKFALQAWYEECGAAGAAELAARGALANIPPDRAIDVVRAQGMGAAGRSKAAQKRGLDVHALLEAYALTGAPPRPADYPDEVRGYVRGLVRWLVAADPEPIAVERLVANPGLGFAGRLDLRAWIGGRDLVVDLKTNRRGRGYLEAHIQAAGYQLADHVCGEGLSDGCLVVAVGTDGTYEVQRGIFQWTDWVQLMQWHSTLTNAKAAHAQASRAATKAAAA